MQLQQLKLKNFRNYPKRTFEFSQNTTAFIGPNAIGKTNILEAIFLLATGKSFRADKEGEMVEIGNEVGRVLGTISNVQLQISNQIQSTNEQIELEVVITNGFVQGQKAPVKKFLVNGVPRRAIDFIGHARAVLFHPQDLELIHGSPGSRRKYLDFILVQTDREYRRSLFSYEKGIRQRNKLLERIRDEGISRHQLLFWDQLLIKHGNYVTQKRAALIDAMNASAKLFGEFRLNYDASYISASRLDQYAREEVAAATTLVGPHRDDVQFFEGTRDLSKFGSRGEQRLMVLWLKLSELSYVEKLAQERPLFLLDDIFSELDPTHREEVLKTINQQQTIITTTDKHFLPDTIEKIAEVVELT